MSKAELPLDRPPLPEHVIDADAATVDAPAETGKPSRWLRGRRFVIGALVVVALVGPFTWWQVAARTDVLVPGDSSYFGTAAILTAGSSTEYCYADVPGATIVFGFSVFNSGTHAVTVGSIDTWQDMADQQVTIDPELGGLDGPAMSTQTLPVTIPPGVRRIFYLTLHLSNNIVEQGGVHTFGDRVTLHATTLGISRTEEFQFGEEGQPLWLGLGGVDDQGKSCDFNQAPRAVNTQ